MTNWTTHPSQHLSGKIKVPGDKSISHRSIIFGALAEGETNITGFLQGEDCIATKKAFQDMGVTITETNEKITIQGVGLNGLKAPKENIDIGNSGTGMRLLAGLLSGQSFASTLVGDDSIMRRPMKRVAEPLSRMGANISVTQEGCAPINISPNNKLHAIEYHQSVASAQIKSALLLASMYAKGETVIHEPGISRNHTENMLKAFGCDIKQYSNAENPTQITTHFKGGQKLKAKDISVPSDISSAAFFIVAGAIAQNTNITISSVGINPTRTGVIDILKLMNANIQLRNQKNDAEPVADIQIQSSELKGIDVPEHLVPLAIDEFPVIFIAAACATGVFTLRNAKELRVKESDRISAMASGLSALGVQCEILEDGIIIHGNPENPFPNLATIESLTDHRIAMAFCIAGIRSSHPITIKDCDYVATSFPNFLSLAQQIGMNVLAEGKHK